MKKILIILIPILILILVSIFVVKLKLTPPTSLNTTKNDLSISELASLNQPTFRFQGKIEKIDGQTLVVNGKPPLDNPIAATDSAAQKISKSTLQALITPETKISGFSSSRAASSSAKLSLADLKINQTVTIFSSTDLRSLKGTEFTAESVLLIPTPVNTIQGKIIDIKDDTLTFETTAIPEIAIPNSKVTIPSQPSKIYQITLIKGIKISTSDPKNPKSLTQADLKANQDAIIFTEDDPLSQTQIKALKIIALIYVLK